MAIPRHVKIEVEKRCNKFAKEFWGVEINIPISFSSRMTRTQGYVQFRRNIMTRVCTPIKMQFAELIFNGHFDEEYINGILKHEVCHYALCILKKPFSDGDYYFKAECSRVNAPLKGRNGSKKNEMVPYSFGLNTKALQPKTVSKKETTKKQSPKTETKQAACEVKPAQRVKNAFASMMSNITEAQIKNLTNEAFCAKTFGLKYSFLKEFKSDNDRKVFGHNRYYAGTLTIYGKQYIMSNDIYRKNADLFEAYAKA